MTDFDEVKVKVNGTGAELVSVEPNVGEQGDVVGGEILCRNQFGDPVIALIAGDEAPESLSGGEIHLRGGAFVLAAANGKDRVRLHAGDPFENEDGGVLILTSSDNASIALDASKRSIVVRKSSGVPFFQLDVQANLVLGGGGVDGDIALTDGAGHPRVNLSGTEHRILIKSPEGDDLAQLIGGTLNVGGKNEAGKLTVRDASAKPRVGVDGSTGSITADGSITAGGSITAKGSITASGTLFQQRTTTRSRAVVKQQHYDLFSANQNGAFIVELAASIVIQIPNQPPTRNYGYQRWIVFTHAGAPFDKLPADEIQGQNPFWTSPSPDLVNAGGKVRLQLGDIAYAEPLSDATVQVRALYGSILDF